MTVLLLRGDAAMIPLADGSVHACITSPPYYGLRMYRNVAPSVWGGDPAHEHVFGALERGKRKDMLPADQTASAGRSGMTDRQDGASHDGGRFCACGAWRGCLGNEPTPALYVEHMVACFREVRRVLRDDGVCWLNLGDSFSASGGGKQTADGKRVPLNDENAGRDFARGDRTQPSNLLGIPWTVAFALQADGWILRNDIVWAKKCLSGGAVVYAKTQKGEMPMTVKDMVRLRPETVQLWNGEAWCRVVGWTRSLPVPDRKRNRSRTRYARLREGSATLADDLEIEFRSGEHIGCTRDHRWPTRRGLLRADELRIGDVVARCRIPAPERTIAPAALPDVEVGWLVGFYLAEGNEDGRATIFSCGPRDGDHVARIGRLAETYGASFNVFRSKKSRSVVVRVHGDAFMGVVQQYIAGRTAHDKHLQPRAWQRSDAFLRAVLDGYLAGDGGWQVKSRRWGLGFCKNDQLASDLRTIGGRVGASVRLRRAKHHDTVNDKWHEGWRGHLRMERTGHQNERDDGEVMAIRHSRARCYWDIAVEGEPHLFALASGLLTHNSAMPESVSGVRWERHRVKVASGTVKRDGLNGSGRRPHGETIGEPQRVGTFPDRPQQDHDGHGFLARAAWRDCEGCEKCHATDGYVLRRGSWRHTRAHEFVFMLAKTADYYCDADAAKEPLKPSSVARIALAVRSMDAGIEPASYGGGTLRRDKSHALANVAARYRSGNGFKRDARESYRDADGPRGDDAQWVDDGTGRNPRTWMLLGPEPLKAAHFAAMPTKLVEPLLLASTSAKGCCAKCGAPWARVVHRKSVETRDGGRDRNVGGRDDGFTRLAFSGGVRTDQVLASGWRATCACADAGDPVPCVVLDPFAGSGTVGRVAIKHRRMAVLLDASGEYLREIADDRTRGVQVELGMEFAP